jgi:signal transduction histidine kinase
MKFRRQNFSPLTPVLVILLLILLGVLATMQYRWLTQISRAERERLQSRLRTDARRLSQDFNGEISKAYFIFQLDARIWEKENYNVFAERFDSWNANAAFPNIVGEIYFVGEQQSMRFNSVSRNFENVGLPAEIASLRDRLIEQKREGISSFIYDKSRVDEPTFSLTVPVFKSEADQSNAKESNSHLTEITMKSSPEGFIIVKFDRAAMIGEMLPELVRKNFAGDVQSYDFFVTNNSGEMVFQSVQATTDSTEPDAAGNLFDLSPETSNVVILNGGYSDSTGGSEKIAKIVRKKIDNPIVPNSATNEDSDYQANSDEQPRKVRIMRKGINHGGESSDESVTDKPAEKGLWLLRVRHKQGSLENAVGKTKWRNLGLSFSVLLLLGTSVVLLIISAQRSRRAAQRQFDFVSSVSHEFRTPVAVIRSAGVNLARGIVSNPAQVRKYGDLIDHEGSRIGEMVEQILEFAGARSNRKNYDFQTIYIAPLVEQVLKNSQSFLEQNNFVVEKKFEPGLPPIIADAKSLRQAFENIVGNAVKYSGENRRIKISAFSEGKYVAVAIEDQGIGISASDLKHIFEPFYRGREAVAEQIRGSGLGLNLVKRIIEAHNGNISVESEPGEGSKFIVKIPANSSNGSIGGKK